MAYKGVVRGRGPAQLPLAIDLRRRPRGRGGWRPGAGRKRGDRVSHGARERLSGREPVHVTLRVCPDAAGLRRPKIFPAVRGAIAGAQGATFRIVESNVLGTHLHLIVEAASAGDLARGVQRFASRLALRINRVLGRRGGAGLGRGGRGAYRQ